MIDRRAAGIHRHKLRRRRHNRCKITVVNGKVKITPTWRYAHGKREAPVFTTRQPRPMKNQYWWNPETQATEKVNGRVECV